MRTIVAAAALLAMLTAAAGLTVKNQSRFFNPPSVWNDFHTTDANGVVVEMTPNERVDRAFRAINEDAIELKWWKGLR